MIAWAINWVKSVLTEKSGVSSTRVMSFISLFVGAYLAIHGLNTTSDLMGLSALCAVFVGAAFGGKVWQKSMELKSTPTDASGKVKAPPPPQN